MLLRIRRMAFSYPVALHAAALLEPPGMLGAWLIVRRQVTLIVRARSKRVYLLLRLVATTRRDEYTGLYLRHVL
jgi:hypothetical protein